MFGLFKPKKSAADAQFDAELLTFSVDFSDLMNALDPNAADGMMTNAYNNYYSRDPVERGLRASDIYLNAFTGAMFTSMEAGLLPPHQSLQVFSMVDSFLRGHGKYQTSFVNTLMNTWQKKLISLGAIEA
jgi:hypothetical protein